MAIGLKNFFRPPVFDDPEKDARARSIFTVIIGAIILTLLYLVYAIFFPPPGQIIIAVLALLLEIGLFILVRSKRIILASAILTSTLWLAVVVEVGLYGGIRDTGFGAFVAIVLIAGLTMGLRSSFLFAGLSIFAGGGLAVAESAGVLPPYSNVSLSSVLLSHSITIISVVFLSNLAIQSISKIARMAIDKEKAEREANSLLKVSQSELQQRSDDLEQKNTTLQAIASVARLIDRVENEDEFLEEALKLIMDYSKFEVISVYLVDQVDENAILKTIRSTTENHNLNLGNELPVIRSEFPSLLMKTDTLYFKIGHWNYYIEPPKTAPGLTANLVFPMTNGEKLLGLLNIQTIKKETQTIENETIQMLADQIAISLANINLIDQLQSRIQQISALSEASVQNAWDQVESGKTIGYSYDRLKVHPTDESFPLEVRDRLIKRESVSFVDPGDPPRSRLVTPIVLRGSIIGVIGYDSDNPDHEWKSDEKALLETVASRVSLALENSRLVAEAQERAERERMLSRVTTRMRETMDIEMILKTAVNEMRQSFALSEAEVRLQFLEEDSASSEVSHE